ncbi:MAG: NADH:ubiquinone reductase (Na(+)-transporting) subunit B [Prevotella sp.]|nr:NADH:ubiquinone reductase (Na(+)-transporting) subunit B [Prevotella sp.]
MSLLRNYLNKIKPNFEKGGKLHAFQSVFDGFETFLYVPNTTAKTGTHIHDAIDSKRIMSMVVIALMPAMLFGMYNVGYQNYLAAGTLASASFLEIFFYGFLAVLPKILVSYIVGLGIEFAWAQWKGEEIQEGYLVSGILIPLIIPIGCPLWMLALACAFSVIFCKEIFGGTGMNIFNPAIAARMFLFFSYPAKMTGDTIWVAQDSIFGLGNNLPDTFTAATPLGEIGQGIAPNVSVCDMICGFIPGSIGETSVIAIAIGAVILLWTGIASWRTMLSVFVGGAVFAFLFYNTNQFTVGCEPVVWWHHFVMGGFAFGAVFMATDPVTSCRTTTGQYIYGFLIGAMAIIIRVMNAGYPEGMMLAIFFGNMCAPMIDHFVVERNISKRMKRGGTK